MAGDLRVFEGRKAKSADVVLPVDPDGPEALLVKVRQIYTLSPVYIRGLHVLADHLLQAIKAGQIPRY